MKTKLKPLCLSVVISALCMAACAQSGTAFTYQGRLTAAGGAAANGAYDLSFTLFNTNINGVAVAGPVTNSPVIITNQGLFTVTVDFGNVFDGSPRWLEIGVRTNGSTGAFSVLSPRQQITPAPYALNASMLASGVALGDGLDNLVWTAGGQDSFIGGGSNNLVYAQLSFVGGGEGNTISFNPAGAQTMGATIGGGILNSNLASYATVGGGIENGAGGMYSTVAGGSNNVATDDGSTVGGGSFNVASGIGSTVAGGEDNFAGPEVFATDLSSPLTSRGASPLGLLPPSDSLVFNFVGGGNLNSAYGQYSDIGGGYDNSTRAVGATVAGGEFNWAFANYTTIAGGSNNIATGQLAAIGGGEFNQAGGSEATIPGGTGNTASGNDSAVAGGDYNTASATDSTVGGGDNNAAKNTGATVPGGEYNTAGGVDSFAAGYKASAGQDHSFVWSDGGGAFSDIFGFYNADRAGQFKIQAAGGVEMDVSGSSGVNPAALFINSTSANGVGLYVLQTNSSDAAIVINTDATLSEGVGDLIKGFGWSPPQGFGSPNTVVFEVTAYGDVTGHSFNSTSDRNAKENFASVSPAEILEKVASIPISQWNFKGQQKDVQHIGPMAQDFHAAFGLNGGDDKHINMTDEGGVALAAIQGLNQKVETDNQSMENRLAQRDAEIDSLQQQTELLKQQLAALQQAIMANNKRN